jgi:hypothetical protein
MTVRVYAWDDAGAPVLTGEVGTFAHLLRKCLVDGYGSGEQAKAGAGWEMEWDSVTNARAAFRSQQYGHEAWYYIDDTGAVGAGGALHARIWMAEAFAGWDEGGLPLLTNRVPTAAQSTWGRSVTKSTVLSSAVVPWVLVTDGAAVWLFIDARQRTGFVSNSYAGVAYFWGCAVGFAQAVTPEILIAGRAENDAAQAGSYTSALMGGSGHYALRDLAVSSLSVDATIVPPAFGTNGSGDGLWSTQSGIVADYFWIAVGGAPAGRLPAARYSAHTHNALDFREQIVIDGRRHVYLKAGSSTSSRSGGCLIDIDGPWYDEVSA